MSLLLAAALQVASALPPETIDLTVNQQCREARTDGEVVVCAKRGDSPYRLRESPPIKHHALPNAEVEIADGVSAGLETESADVGGIASNRFMVRLKVKF